MCTQVAFVTQVCASVVFAICIETGWRFVREAKQNTDYSKLVYAVDVRTEIRAACDSANLIQMLLRFVRRAKHEGGRSTRIFTQLVFVLEFCST